jgi:uncharacterized protein YciI
VGQKREPIRDVVQKQNRFAYFYLMKNDPERVRLVAPKHVSHWQGLGFAHYLGGPFEDRTGGLITFESDEANAQHAVREDPFMNEDLVETHWLKPWMPE